MKLLLVGDSHCRELGPALTKHAPSTTTLTVFLPRNINAITLKYRTKIQTINSFRPDVVVVHLGHNDMVRHPIHNLIPSVSTVVASATIILANEIHLNHPYATIFISVIFPHTFTSTSLLSSPEISSYNKKAKRHGQRIRTFSTTAGYNCLINNVMWSKISNSIEEPSFFLLDGLHLNSTGQTAIVKEWLEEITRMTT
jgi:lysophospholipase L1-like esterase